MYFAELKKFLYDEYSEIYMCPFCSCKTLTPDKKCLACLYSFNDKIAFGYVRCGYCGKESVIYDALNISNNNNMIRGLCLNCDNDTTVYKCPKCNNSVNLELFKKDNCKPDACKFD